MTMPASRGQDGQGQPRPGQEKAWLNHSGRGQLSAASRQPGELRNRQAGFLPLLRFLKNRLFLRSPAVQQCLRSQGISA